MARETVSDGCSDRRTASSEECTEELEQCVCGALHCLHCALQSGQVRDAPASFFKSLLAFLTRLHIAIGSAGEEASDILYQVRRTPDLLYSAAFEQLLMGMDEAMLTRVKQLIVQRRHFC